MSKQNETGHVKNLANFKKLIDKCIGFNKDYNPSTASLSVSALQTLSKNAEASMKDLVKAETALDNATNARFFVYENYRTWATSIVNAFEISGADQKAIEDIRGINHKIQGSRVEKLPKQAPDAKPNDDGSGKHISVSQLSFDNVKSHFEKLLETLQQDGNYKPNESGLAMPAIAKKIIEMSDANNKLSPVETAYNNKLIARDNIMNEPKEGLIDIAKAVKKYVKTVYSANSPQFKEVDALHFKKIER